MTQEEKQLLLTDLCGRLPYGVKINIEYYDLQGNGKLKNRNIVLSQNNIGYCFQNSHWASFKPYLRPMSSMTEEEYKEYDKETDLDVKDCAETLRENLKAKTRVRISKWYHGNDWLNAHHFDYRGLIEKGLALEAPEDMYKIK